MDSKKLEKVKDELKEQIARSEVQDKMLPDYLKKLKQEASLEYLNGAKPPPEGSQDKPPDKPPNKAAQNPKPDR